MKSTMISMMIVLVLMVALPMIFLGDSTGPGGGFNLKFPGSDQSSAKLPSNIKPVSTDTTVQMYKWRDANGVMQFSNTPPTDGSSAEKMELKPNLTTIRAVKVAEVEPTAATATASPEMANPYTPSGMKQLVEQANSMKDVLNQQQLDQQKKLQNITRR